VHLAQRHRVLAGALAANVGQFGTRTVISPLVPLIVLAFDISNAAIGGVLTLSWAMFAVGQYPSGAVADRYGERRVISAALLVAIGTSAAVALAPSFAAFALAAALLGGGTGFYFAVGTSLLDRQFDETGGAFGLHSSGAPLAGVLLPLVALWAASQWNWRAGMLVGTVTAALGLLVFRASIGPTPPAAPEGALNRLKPRAALRTLRRPAVLRAVALGCVGIYAFQSFVSFLPTFLQAYAGLGEGVASAAFSGAFLLVVIGNPTAGLLADRFGTDLGMAVPMALTGAGFALAVARPDLALAGVALIGAGATWGGPLQTAVMRAVDEDGGSGFAIARSTYLLIGASGNVITGTLADRVGWDLAYGVVAGLLFVTAAVLFVERALGDGRPWRG
jgi:predicted MFS family arabinose efflux permease